MDEASQPGCTANQYCTLQQTLCASEPKAEMGTHVHPEPPAPLNISWAAHCTSQVCTDVFVGGKKNVAGPLWWHVWQIKWQKNLHATLVDYAFLSFVKGSYLLQSYLNNNARQQNVFSISYATTWAYLIHINVYHINGFSTACITEDKGLHYIFE